MKNLKKVTCLTVLLGAMILSVASCGGNKPAATTTAAATTTTAATTVADSTSTDKTEGSESAETEATEDVDGSEEETDAPEKDEPVTDETADDNESGDNDAASQAAAFAELDPLLGDFVATLSNPPFTLTYRLATEESETVMTLAVGGETQAYVSTVTTVGENQQAVDILYDGDAMYMIDPVGKKATKMSMASDDIKSSIAQSSMVSLSDPSGYTATRESAEFEGATYQVVKLENNETGEAVSLYFNDSDELKYMSAADNIIEVLNFSNEVDASVFTIAEDIEVTEMDLTGGADTADTADATDTADTADTVE